MFILIQKFSFHSLSWVTKLDPTFNMFLASKASLSLVPCLPAFSTVKTNTRTTSQEQAELNSQCLTVNRGNMTTKAITFRITRGGGGICNYLAAAKQGVLAQPLAHALLLASAAQRLELRPDFIHGQSECSHCRNTRKTLLGACKQSCG